MANATKVKDKNHSILWNDSTLNKDRALVRYLVENIVAGKKVDGHYEMCAEKIMDKILTKEWQIAFPHRTHVFSIHYAISVKSVAEIKLSPSQYNEHAVYSSGGIIH